MQNQLQKIKLIITDIDGVLTDGCLYYTADGESLKKFFARDGLGITIAQAAGIKIAALSGRDSPTLRKRLADLKISLFCLGKLDKQKYCLELMQQAGVTAEETLYIGDDTVDLAAFDICGFNCTVNDAADYIKQQANYVTQAKGGYGALREIIDKILFAQDKGHLITSSAGFLSIVKHTHQ